jgi:hypothetical protein
MLTGRESRRADHESRSFVDKQGVSWRVFHRQADGEVDSLIFESESAYRRVRTFPADWRALSSEELCRLSWMR